MNPSTHKSTPLLVNRLSAWGFRRLIETGLCVLYVEPVRIIVLLALLMGLGALPQARADELGGSKPFEPQWSKKELTDYLNRVGQVSTVPPGPQRDRALAEIAGLGYRVSPKPGENTEQLAQRVLRKRKPQHPAVKSGQWLTACMRQFYADIAKRSKHWARFTIQRKERQFFEQTHQQAKQAADTLAKEIKLVVDGLDDSIDPLPSVGGDEPSKRGATAKVTEQKITIERLDRVRFSNHQPPDDVPRTAKGAIKEIFSSQKQYNITAQMLGRYDKEWRRNHGHVQVIIPARYPARYLNEIVRGAIPAKMHTVHLMTLSKQGKLRELPLSIVKKKAKRSRRKKKKPATISVHCRDQQPMDKCAQKIKHALSQGPVYYQADS